MYSKLPVFFQEALVSAEGWRIARRRFGGDFSKLFQAACDRFQFGAEQLRAYQEERLRSHLIAASQTPYWQQVFRTTAVQPDSPEPFLQLAKLPVLRKGEVRNNADAFVNPAVPARCRLSCHTSGTTGAGLIFYETRQAEQERWAVWWRYREKLGLRQGTWCGYFGGRTIVPSRQQVPPFWRTNQPGKQVLFSAYHLRRETAPLYHQKIREAKLPWLHGYPSQLAVFAHWVRRLKLSPLESLRVITTGAESLLQPQRQLLADVFKVPVYQHYGLSECVANLSECREGSMHVDEDYAGVEFVPSEGNPETYSIVGTNWSNAAFPLLRYDTGDTVTLAREPCRCGRPGRRVTAIDGRQEDYVRLPDGSCVGRLDHIFKDMVQVQEAQIYQPSQDQLVFRVVKGDRYDAEGGEQMVRREARQRLGEEIAIRFEYVDQIAKTKQGKLRFVVSDLKRGSAAPELVPWSQE